jgi:hypothetical protein
MQNFTIFDIPKCFSPFNYLQLDYSIGKELKIGKSSRAIFLRAGLFVQHSRPSPLLQTGLHLFLLRVTVKWAPVPCGPRVSALLLSRWEPLRNRPDTVPVTLPNPPPSSASTPLVIATRNSHQFAAKASLSSHHVNAHHTPCRPCCHLER